MHRSLQSAVCSLQFAVWAGHSSLHLIRPLVSPPHARPTWSHCNCDYHLLLTVSDRFPLDRSDYECICSNGSFPNSAYDCVRFITLEMSTPDLMCRSFWRIAPTRQTVAGLTTALLAREVSPRQPSPSVYSAPLIPTPLPRSHLYYHGNGYGNDHNGRRD